LEHCPQSRLQKFRHGFSLPRRFLFQTLHDLIVNVERSLHMENHTVCMAIGQLGFSVVSLWEIPVYLFSIQASNECDLVFSRGDSNSMITWLNPIAVTF
jgi:hypothetical protein